MRELYRSRSFVATLVMAIIGLLSGAVLLFADQRLTSGRFAAPILVGLGVLILSAGFLFSRRMDVFSIVIETDGVSWVRELGGDRDVLILRDSLEKLEYAGRTAIARSAGATLKLTPDCIGYERVRDLLERWQAEKDR